MSSLNSDQSDLQFGFTKNTSPAMASLLISEASLDAKISEESLGLEMYSLAFSFNFGSFRLLVVLRMADKFYILMCLGLIVLQH